MIVKTYSPPVMSRTRSHDQVLHSSRGSELYVAINADYNSIRWWQFLSSVEIVRGFESATRLLGDSFLPLEFVWILLDKSLIVA